MEGGVEVEVEGGRMHGSGGGEREGGREDMW